MMLDLNYRHLAGPLVGRHGLSVRHLEVFWAVMRTGSQSRAAKLLGISQPAVSKMMGFIEQRTGITFFFRSRGRMVPSAEASVFFRSVEQIFEQVYQTEILLDDLQHRVSGEISVAFAPGLGASLIARFVADFRRTHPHSRLRVKLLSPPVIAERAVRQEIDIGVYHGPMGDFSLSSVVLAEHAVLCVLPKSHPLAAKKAISPEMLRGENILSGSLSGPRQWVHLVSAVLEEHGIDYKPTVECLHAQHLYEFASSGLGIALTPPLPFPGDKLDVVTRQFVPRVDAPLFAVMPVGRPPAQATTSLVKSMQRVLAGAGAQDPLGLAGA